MYKVTHCFFQSMVGIQTGARGLRAVDIVALVFKVVQGPAVILNLLFMVLDVPVAVKKPNIVNIRQSVLVKVVTVSGLNGLCVLRHVEPVPK